LRFVLRFAEVAAAGAVRASCGDGGGGVSGTSVGGGPAEVERGCWRAGVAADDVRAVAAESAVMVALRRARCQ